MENTYLRPPDPSSDDPMELVYFTDAYIDQTLDRLHSALAGPTEASTAATRELSWLASGSLVLTISLYQVFTSGDPLPSHGWMMILGWVLFVIALFCTLFRRNAFVTFRAPRLRLELQRAEIRRAVKDLPRDESFPKAYDKILNDAFSKAWSEADEAVRPYDIMNYVGVGSLLAGIVLSLVFIILNSPI